MQTAFYPADGRSTRARIRLNLMIRVSVSQHAGYFQSLREGLQFTHSAKIIEETVAFVQGREAKYSPKQLI